MVLRYAVLWSLEDVETMPIGVAVDMGDHVFVDVPDHYCLATRHRGEYRVVQPDGSPMILRPSDDSYFEQVLADLSRTFAVVERGQLDVSDAADVMELLREKVLDPLTTTYVAHYRPSYGSLRYRHEEADVTPASSDGRPLALVA